MNAQQILDSVYGTQTTDPVAAQLAAVLAQYTQEFQAGNLSRDEYLELIQDLHTEHLIDAQCQDLEAKIRLNQICNAVISAASVLSSV
jgi:Mg2+/Co2+ transporter CorC